MMEDLEESIADTYDLIRSLRLGPGQLHNTHNNAPRVESQAEQRKQGVTRRSNKASNKPAEEKQRNVVDELLGKGVEYETRRNAAKQKQLEMEMQEVKGSPDIDPLSRQLAAKVYGSKALDDRMKQFQRRVEQKHELLRHALAEKDLEELRPGPEINTTSKRLVQKRQVGDMLTWEMKRKLKLEEERCKKQERELLDCNFTPRLCEKSLRLAAKSKRRSLTKEKVPPAQDENISKENTRRSLNNHGLVDPKTANMRNTITSPKKNMGNTITSPKKALDEDDDLVLLRSGGYALLKRSSLFS